VELTFFVLADFFEREQVRLDFDGALVPTLLNAFGANAESFACSVDGVEGLSALRDYWLLAASRIRAKKRLRASLTCSSSSPFTRSIPWINWLISSCERPDSFNSSS
jgi:hypothetical protein